MRLIERDFPNDHLPLLRWLMFTGVTAFGAVVAWYYGLFQLMLASDICVAADSTRLSQMEIKRGIAPFGGATLRFAKTCGWQNAMRYLLTADEFDAATALRIGLAQEVTPRGQQVDAALAIARRIAAQAPLAWASPHGHDAGQRLADEAVMITGDGNLVEVQATVRFRITNPDVYLFEVRDADEIVRASAESVLRGLIAGRPFLELLTTRRGEFQATVLRRLRQRCADYQLGIELEGFALHDLHPPQEVVPAYHAVQAYTALKVMAEAVKKAGKWDPTAIRDALKDINLPETTFGPVTFDARGQNLHPVLVTQVQKGQYQIVHPKSEATADPVLPTPKWAGR